MNISLTRFTVKIAFCVCWLALLGDFLAAQKTIDLPQKGVDLASASQQDQIEKLAKYLSGSRWEGQFTITGKDLPPTKELYEIIKAEKAEEGDKWNLTVRIKYADHDITLPLPSMEIKWAGKTPVITVDQMMIPGLGTFDARVVIRKGKYAGIWSHDDIGGHLFGTIENQKP